jgi:nucleotide-binding universal stress UspA family protein
MLNKILIPLDGSKSAELALQYGEMLANALGSEIILLHVCSHECQNNQAAHQNYVYAEADDLKQNLTREPTAGGSIKVTAYAEDGNPLEIINRFIEKNNIDFTIMTTAGEAGQQNGILGKVTDHITRTVKIPVLLIRTPAAGAPVKAGPSLKRILAPLDGSPLSRFALPLAEVLAAKLQIPITLFQMVSEFYPYYGDAAPFVDYDKLTAAEKTRVQSELTALQAELTRQGHSVDWSSVVGRDAAYEIIELSKKLSDCLVVMSTHGRSGVGRWAFGSVAEKVIRYGSAPLLMVPARPGRQT